MNDTDDLLPTRWTLISRLKNWDDQESWREFFELYWKLIYGMAVKAGLSSAEAQDVVQETIISVCKKIKEFKTDPACGSFKSWLFKLTRWRILDQVRKRPREDYKKGTRRDSPTTSTIDRIPDPSADVLERNWESEWQRNLTSAALERLEKQVNAKHYQVFFLHAIKQHPAKKVAVIAGIDVNQVYLIKHRLGGLFQEAVKELEAKMQ